MQIAVVLYPGFTALDLIGPYEVLRALPGADVRFVWHETGPVTADSGVLVIGATHTLAETTAPDVVLVPGGFSTMEHGRDEVLLDFARQMQEFVRRSDCFGRIGGEEFMLILPDTTISEGNRILDRLLEKVRSSRPLENIPEFFYTCSVGLAEYRDGDSVSDLYARADQALYLAKRDGRDQVRRYTLPGSDQESHPDQTA